jgi:hypothetical protein
MKALVLSFFVVLLSYSLISNGNGKKTNTHISLQNTNIVYEGNAEKAFLDSNNYINKGKAVSASEYFFINTIDKLNGSIAMNKHYNYNQASKYILPIQSSSELLRVE